MGRRTSHHDGIRSNSTFLGAVVVLVIGAIIAIPYCGPVPLVIIALAIATAWILVHWMFAGD